MRFHDDTMAEARANVPYSAVLIWGAGHKQERYQITGAMDLSITRRQPFLKRHFATR